MLKAIIIVRETKTNTIERAGNEWKKSIKFFRLSVLCKMEIYRITGRNTTQKATLVSRSKSRLSSWR